MLRKLELPATIRPFRLKAIQRLEKLHTALCLDPDVEEDIIVDEENTKKWRKQLLDFHKEDKNQILIAEINGEIVGYILFYNPINERFGFKTKHCFGGIIELYVMPEFRRKGVASQLIQRCVDYLKSKGAIDVRVDVLMHNKKAMNLYQKHGFKDWVAILKKSYKSTK